MRRFVLILILILGVQVVHLLSAQSVNPSMYDVRPIIHSYISADISYCYHGPRATVTLYHYKAGYGTVEYNKYTMSDGECRSQHFPGGTTQNDYTLFASPIDEEWFRVRLESDQSDHLFGPYRWATERLRFPLILSNLTQAPPAPKLMYLATVHR